MRKLFIVVALMAAAVAVAQVNVAQDPTATATCSSGGGTAVNVPSGSYLMTVTGADSFVCRSETTASCASGGVLYPVGTVILISVPGSGSSRSYACRSAASSVQFTKLN